MSPRTVKRRRRSKGQLTATAGSPTTLLAQVTELVSENQALVRENKELHTIIARVTQAVHVVSSAPRGNGRRLQVGRAAAPKANGHPRQRRRITDPASLERRRAALAKARQVLAERRAAEKAGQ